MKLCGVYLITHIESGQKYVGQSRNIQKRLTCHARGVENTKIGCSVLKYGWAAFTTQIIELCAESELNAIEKRWIAQHSCMSPCGFNLTSGGSSQTKYSDETKAKIGLANSKRVISDVTRAKMSAAKQNISDETRARMSAGKLGKSLSDAHKAKIRAASKLAAPMNIARLAEFNTGKKQTPESIAKRAASHTGTKRSAEACARMSAAINSRPVTQAMRDSAAKMSAGNIGRKRSAEYIERLSASLKGRKKSPEAITNSVKAKAANRLARQHQAIALSLVALS